MSSDGPFTPEDIEFGWPNLPPGSYEITSPFDKTYNCIAWAAGDQRQWWEPDPMGEYYWPREAPRRYTIGAYQRAFETLGYRQCSEDTYEDGTTRVALFGKGDVATHASRQISSTRWTSKLGDNVDITHDLQDVCGDLYGQVVMILSRAEPPTQPSPPAPMR